MKKLFITYFSLFIFDFSFSQTSNNSTTLKICGSNAPFEYRYAGHYIFFYPASYKENLLDNINFCTTHKRVYYMDNLELSEDQYWNLNIKANEIVNKRGQYIYINQTKDTVSCIEQTNMIFSVNIPIFLNGIELKGEEKNVKLKKILPNQIVSIKHKNFLFFKKSIKIRTALN